MTDKTILADGARKLLKLCHKLAGDDTQMTVAMLFVAIAAFAQDRKTMMDGADFWFTEVRGSEGEVLH